ncbi:Large-conductance mechanosensitive channel [compost metagenome]
MFCRIRVASAEDDGETGHQQSDDQGKVDEMQVAAADAEIGWIDHHRDGAGHRFQLQRDIGHSADQREHGDDRCYRGVLAITGGNEIGDRGEFFRFGQFDDTADDRHAERKRQDRPHIDCRKFQPALGSKAHAAEIGPGGAVDGKAQGIDERTPAFGNTRKPTLSVAVTRHCKKQQDIGECRDKNDPAWKHVSSPRRHVRTGDKIKRKTKRWKSALPRQKVQCSRTVSEDLSCLNPWLLASFQYLMKRYVKHDGNRERGQVMSVVSEFRSFIAKGNVIDLAVGIIIGGAFTGIVTSLVNDIVMPVVGAITGGGFDFSNYFIALSSAVTAPSLEEARKQGAVFAYGSFITVMINFVILAFIIFLMVKGVNRLRAMEEKKPVDEKPAPPPADIQLLSEIRDILKTK